MVITKVDLKCSKDDIIADLKNIRDQIKDPTFNKDLLNQIINQ
jgi:hypothetical protein